MAKGEENPGFNPRMLAEIEPYLEIARSLHQAIALKTAGEEVTALNIEAAWDSALQEVAGPVFKKALLSMDEDELLSLYRKEGSREDLTATLEEVVALRAAAASRTLRIQRLRQQSELEGLVYTNDFQPGEIIRIGLFKPMNISNAYKDGPTPPARTLSLRWLEPATALAEVVSDTRIPGSAAAERLAAGQQYRFGSAPNNDTLPRLSVHMPLRYGSSERDKFTDEIIGYIETNEGHVVLNGFGKTTTK